MSFRSSYLEDLAKTRNNALNVEARAKSSRILSRSHHIGVQHASVQLRENAYIWSLSTITICRLYYSTV